MNPIEQELDRIGRLDEQTTRIREELSARETPRVQQAADGSDPQMRDILDCLRRIEDICRSMLGVIQANTQAIGRLE